MIEIFIDSGMMKVTAFWAHSTSQTPQCQHSSGYRTTTVPPTSAEDARTSSGQSSTHILHPLHDSPDILGGIHRFQINKYKNLCNYDSIIILMENLKLFQKNGII